MNPEYISDDIEYKKWLAHHLNGFVLNVGGRDKKQVVMIHLASCSYINNDGPRKLAEGANAKVCGTSIESLRQWAAEHDYAEPFKKCSACIARKG